jgi:hypothetical protein
VTMVDHAAATAWLAQADRDPEHALAWWYESPDHAALLPVGTLFDIVETSLSLALRAVELHIGSPDGPVFVDRTGETASFLIPVGTAVSWRLDGSIALGDATYAWMPSPTMTGDEPIAWIWPPDGSGELWDVDALRAVLSRAS